MHCFIQKSHLGISYLYLLRGLDYVFKRLSQVIFSGLMSVYINQVFSVLNDDVIPYQRLLSGISRSTVHNPRFSKLFFKLSSILMNAFILIFMLNRVLLFYYYMKCHVYYLYYEQFLGVYF